MGLFTVFDRWMGDSRLAKDQRKLHDYGRDVVIPGGDKLTEEGITGLRGLRGTYADRLKDPLGEVGRGIFARARGNLSDDFARTVNAGVARRSQLAAQSGGSLSAEQISAADSQDRRMASEGLFRGENELSMGEADLTLQHQSKFFDRMEGIDRTIAGIGQDEKMRGLQAIIAALTGRYNRANAIASTTVSAFGVAGKG